MSTYRCSQRGFKLVLLFRYNGGVLKSYIRGAVASKNGRTNLDLISEESRTLHKYKTYFACSDVSLLSAAAFGC